MQHIFILFIIHNVLLIASFQNCIHIQTITGALMERRQAKTLDEVRGCLKIIVVQIINPGAAAVAEVVMHSSWMT